MSLIERLRKGINAYVKNDAKAAAIASVLANKDCSAKDLVETSGFDKAVLGLMPLLNNKLIPHEPNSLADAVYRILKHNTSGRILYLLCGPSSAGKDTLASYAKHRLYIERMNFSYVDKYTTRQRRGHEGLSSSGSHAEPSGNYQYFKDKNEVKSRKDDIALGYSIYDHYYAFSGNHLLSQDIEDKVLMCIYGRFENIYKVRSEIFFKYKRIPYSVLLTAPPENLEGRILRRHSLSETEQVKRSREMKRQVDFIRANKGLMASGFDLIIENGDEHSVQVGQQELTDFIRSTMELGSKALAADW